MKTHSLRKLTLLASVCTLFLATPITCHASERLTIDTFDYEEYADRYPDLKQNLGYNKDSLWSYYQTYGEQHGRRPGITPAAFLTSSNFDAAAYAAANPDVAATLGTDATVLLQHYLTIGYREGRLASGLNPLTDSKCKAYLIAHQITLPSMTDLEKIKIVHDWIINHTTYDYSGYSDRKVPYISHMMSGVMQKGTAVCDGYATTFLFFMDVLGIPCRIETTSTHAWNCVLVDGMWYRVDCTYDDPVLLCNGIRTEVCRYDYFMLPVEPIE